MDRILDLPLWLLIAIGLVLAIGAVVFALWVLRSGRSLKVGPIEIGQKPSPPPKPASDGPAALAIAALDLAERHAADRADRHRSLSTWYTYALVEPQELIHVDELVDDLTSAIASQSHSSALTVSGAGGLGKTAITYEAVERVAKQGDFTHIVWASAKNTRFSASDASAASVNSIYWHDVLALIAGQIDCPLSPTQALWEQELRDHLEHVLGNSRLLVVVDNLEVVHAVDHVIDELRVLGMRRPHKIVATTRWAVTNGNLDVRDIKVPPLRPRQTYDLVRLVARGSDSDLATANDRELRRIHDITEENPFLIKLIARRYLMTGRSLPRIIDELTAISNELGNLVRKWLFDQSLNELKSRSSEADAVALLFSFCGNARGGAMTCDELHNESDISEVSRFDSVLEAACQLGLVRPSDRNQRYSIHSLLYEYTCPLVFELEKFGEA